MKSIEWEPLIKQVVNLEVQTKVQPTKGNLVYEYNPFRNYRLSKNMYEYLGAYYSLEDLEDKFGVFIQKDPNNEKDRSKWKWVNCLNNEEPILHEKGELVDFIVDELHLSLDHPVLILPHASYDGSVNLIINDGINIPRLINSRFSATGKNTYEVIDRKGNNDTNIYDQGDEFDVDTSLYKRVIKIPKIVFNGETVGGNLKVGNYHFYFKLADADGNESDFVGESGTVSVFIGFNDPTSIHTGNKDENSYKNVVFSLSNLDSSYDYVQVYYSRAWSQGTDPYATLYKKVDKKYKINTSGYCNIIISGFETTYDVDVSEINLQYNIVDSVETSAICQNMLFLANVHKPNIPYKDLQDLSLRFLPYLKQEEYKVDMDENYLISTKLIGYYDPKFIYDKTGYWGEELYRLGIVYIMPDNSLSPVFNIRGGINITECTKDKYIDDQFTDIKVYNPKTGLREYINSNETTNMLIPPSPILNNAEYVVKKGSVLYENTKGVVRFSPSKDTDIIYSIDVRTDDDTIKELKKYVKGYFFVRLKRIPTILALGITIGIDLTSHTPCIPTAGGFLDSLANSLEKTHVETEDINDVNYISEGFLSRYQFRFKKKKSSVFGKIMKVVGIAVGVVAAAAAVVFTAGAAGAVLGAGAAAGGVAGAVSAGTAAVLTAAGTVAGSLGIGLTGVAALGVVAGGTVAAAAVGTALVGTSQEIRYGLGRAFSKKKLDGRNTKCPSGYKIVETDESRILDLDFLSRCIIKDKSKVKVQGILCPDYELNQPHYNLIFTGNKHKIELTNSLSNNGLSGHSSNYFTNKERHFYANNYYDMNIRNSYEFKVIGVPSDNRLVGIEDFKFRSKAGEPEEVWRYECVGDDYKSEYTKNTEGAEEDSETISNKKINSDIIRGCFGAYLGFNDKDNKFSPAETVNIYIPEFSLSNMSTYVDIRMLDHSAYNAISDRMDIFESDNNLIKPLDHILKQDVDRSSGYSYSLYRGDCYICLFTHRLNRNFNDPSAPYNDEIVDSSTWKNNYDPNDSKKYANINSGDVNAILLGMWVTFKLRSSKNLNIRTLDGSNIEESAMTGHPKGFYPYHPMSVEGTYKHSDSEAYNRGFTKDLSDRWNIEVPDAPYIKNWYGTRIMYSDLYVTDAFKNGFRVFLGSNFLDYTREYGQIVKLITLDQNLLCVFEHGIALIPVNERAVAAQGSGGSVFINTSNVLPENPKIISDMFGSQWPESILKVPGKSGSNILYVYGVDTIAKKIWKTDGQSLKCISDFKVLEFLNNNISLGERELTPKIGIRNVKTVYNAFKSDVMFTFYDNTYGFEEKVWNLCYNELLDRFITFYSWVPSYMENINNIPFSFNRDVSKWIAKLGTSKTGSDFADGITLTNNITYDLFESKTFINKNGDKTKCDNIVVDNFNFDVEYINTLGQTVTASAHIADNSKNKFIGVLKLENRVLPNSEIPYNVRFELMEDPYNNKKMFTIKLLQFTDINHPGVATTRLGDIVSNAKYPDSELQMWGLYFNSGDEEFTPVLMKTEKGFVPILGPDHKAIYTYRSLYNPKAICSELYYRNKAGNVYADSEENKIKWDDKDLNILDKSEVSLLTKEVYGTLLTFANKDNIDIYKALFGNLYIKHSSLTNFINEMGQNPGTNLSEYYLAENNPKLSLAVLQLPIYKDLTGKRPYLPKEHQKRGELIVTLLNIKAFISISERRFSEPSVSDAYYNAKANYNPDTNLVDMSQYESVVALMPRHNMQFLTSDFWKHGLAGIMDIADKIYPTYWYGKLHPFEFECIVVNDPSIHKIFTNLEIISNNVQPESFHYEIIGDSYDFAADKPNMYFRQEAMKALWQYNGTDILYNRNFLSIPLRQLHKSADMIHTYFGRLDTFNDIEDYYISATNPYNKNYLHLSGGEIIYYPNRLEFRIQNHVKAVSIDNLLDTTDNWNRGNGIYKNNIDYSKINSYSGGRSIIAANCQYLEDRWKVLINPILVCYKNEYTQIANRISFKPENSTWAKAAKLADRLLPPLPIMNSPIPNAVLLKNYIKFPNTITGEGKDNALYGLYDLTEFNNNQSDKPLDTKSWVDGDLYGSAGCRKELDVRDKFLKIKIRYSGTQLAIIDFLNTIYRVSYV